VTARVLTILMTLALILAACATDDDPGTAGETGVLTPEPEATDLIDDPPAGSPPESDDVDPENCNGQIGAVVVERVSVPDDASCTLDGTTVEGNVEVGRGGTLEARSVAVDGNLQAQGALAVNIADAEIDGNLQLSDGGSSTVIGTRIDGNLQLENHDGALELTDNTINGNLQATDNTGGLTIDGNTTDGNLDCSGNDPAPTGGGNRVEGNMEGQCSGF
jgi:hypothetical protein